MKKPKKPKTTPFQPAEPQQPFDWDFDEQRLLNAYAGKAMESMIISGEIAGREQPSLKPTDDDVDRMAEIAFDIAEKMLVERRKRLGLPSAVRKANFERATEPSVEAVPHEAPLPEPEPPAE